MLVTRLLNQRNPKIQNLTSLDFPNTSRKHGKKELQSFVHCGSFDHPDLQSLNDCRFSFFGLPTEFLGIWGLLIYHWKGLENTFPTVYYMPQNFKIAVVKQNRKICNCLVTADQGGQKNRNGKTTTLLFYHVFY
jgi:hypothetical protein